METTNDAIRDQIQGEQLQTTDDYPTMLDRFALALAAGPFTYYLPGNNAEHSDHARRIYDLAEALNEERIRRNQATKGDDDGK